MGSKNKEYNEDMQALFIEMMLLNPESYVRVQNIFNVDNFNRPLKAAAAFLKDHVNDHKIMPTLEQINAVCGTTFKALPNLDKEHYEWFLTEFEGFSKQKELSRAILKAADFLEKGDYAPVEKLIKDAVQIGLIKGIGTNYFENPRARLMSIRDNAGVISTGWPCLDAALYGGISRGTLNIIAGGSGCVVADTLVEVIEMPFITQVKDYAHLKAEKVTIASVKDRLLKNLVYVSSPDGWVLVTDCIQKIKNSMFLFTFNSGLSITASHDHLYQKPDQSWHYAKDLKIGDTLLSATGVDKIEFIMPINEETVVYDLSVSHVNHRYYTNQICSHNSGKSLFIQNLGINWFTAGMNGIYVSLELSEDLCSMRTDAMVTNLGTRDLYKNLDDVELKIGMTQKKSGAYQIKFLPMQSTVNDIRAYVKEYQIQTGIKIQFLIVDYLDVMMPAGVKVNPSDIFIKDKWVSEELRNLAIELDVYFFTCSQLNRGAVDEVDFDHSDIAGGLSKVYTADNVFGIYTSRALKEQGKYQLQLLKTRSSNGVGKKVILDFDVNSMRITDSGEDQSSGYNPGANKTSNIMNALKNKSNVKSIDVDSDPVSTDKVPAAKVQADVLRDMLAKLKK